MRRDAWRRSGGAWRRRAQTAGLPEVAQPLGLPFRVEDGVADVVLQQPELIEDHRVAAVQRDLLMVRHSVVEMHGYAGPCRYGGNAMIFDQFGLLKYDVGHSIFNTEPGRLVTSGNPGSNSRPGASKLRRFGHTGQTA